MSTLNLLDAVKVHKACNNVSKNEREREREREKKHYTLLTLMFCPAQNSSAEVVGAVLGVLTVVLIIAVTITITVLFVLGWRVSF